MLRRASRHTPASRTYVSHLNPSRIFYLSTQYAKRPPASYYAPLENKIYLNPDLEPSSWRRVVDADGAVDVPAVMQHLVHELAHRVERDNLIIDESSEAAYVKNMCAAEARALLLEFEIWKSINIPEEEYEARLGSGSIKAILLVYGEEKITRERALEELIKEYGAIKTNDRNGKEMTYTEAYRAQYREYMAEKTKKRRFLE